MILIEGQFYNGLQPVGIPARMELSVRNAVMTAGDVPVRYSPEALVVSPRIGNSDRFITFPDGGQFQCKDDPELDFLRQESKSEGIVAWLEERWGIALAAVTILFVMLLTGYFWGLPIAAEKVAATIPMSTEQELGRQALTWLDRQKWFSPSALDTNKQQKIVQRFNNLIGDQSLKDYYRLEFRNSSFIGPNAFALPGGAIVITDAMVNTAFSVEEVISVLAHEVGHSELRHPIRSVLQQSVIAVVVVAVTNDAASLSSAAAGLPVLLIQNRYSHEIEFEADAYAYKILKAKGYSPAAFASIMERLAKNSKNTESHISFLSSHPSTEERIRRARQAAQ
jgi:predicted Zn-dependent protease